MQCRAIGKVYPPVSAGVLCDLTKNTATILLSPYRPVFPGPHDNSLVLKLSYSGVTFLKPSDERKRWYKQRYVGSKTCAIDENGQLWAKASELKNHEKELQRLKELQEGKGKKNRVRMPPNPKMLLTDAPPGAEGAISELLPDRQNLPTDVEKNISEAEKKTRKKCYKIDKGKVRQRIYAYLNTMKGSKRLYFWTVSFPEHTPDAVCYQAFNTWLTKLRQYGLLKEYLWIAERQKGDRLTDKSKAPTNTIHFHIAIPHYLDVHKANAMMRGTLKGLAKKGALPGVVCNAKNRDHYYLPSIAKYNGVDICKHRTTRKPINFAVKKGARALAHYLTKYVTKNDAGQTNNAGELIEPGFDHLAWHCSRGFSRLFTAITCTLTEFKQAGLGGYLNRIRVFDMEYVTFVPWLYGPPPLLLDHLYKLNSHIQKLFDNEQPGQTTGSDIR